MSPAVARDGSAASATRGARWRTLYWRTAGGEARPRSAGGAPRLPARPTFAPPAAHTTEDRWISTAPAAISLSPHC
ncbi:hypothetical protein CFB52_015645 [Burkholderia sp. AU18528]|nr:hypothetical protein CFB52_015645 [Burkholderia sp. AU18528]